MIYVSDSIVAACVVLAVVAATPFLWTLTELCHGR